MGRQIDINYDILLLSEGQSLGPVGVQSSFRKSQGQECAGLCLIITTSFGEMLIFILELPMTDKLAFENMTKIS